MAQFSPAKEAALKMCGGGGALPSWGEEGQEGPGRESGRGGEGSRILPVHLGEQEVVVNVLLQIKQ